LVEERAFQRRKRRKRKKPAAVEASDSESSDSSSDSESETEGNEPPAANVAPALPRAAAAPVASPKNKDDGKEWGKKVEDALRKYASTRGCRRDIADQYFNNPARRGAKNAALFNTKIDVETLISSHRRLLRQLQPPASSPDTSF
jgi:bloom syndrome protein